MNESQAKARLVTLESADIMRLLPHRYPFLLVDRIIDMDGDRSATGIKNVTANEPHLQRQIAGNPIMPGVLLIEGMAQTAGELCISFAEGLKAAPLVYFMAIDKARFRRPVFTGDTIFYHIKKMRGRGRIWRFGAQAIVNSTLVAEAEISAVLVEEERR